MTDGDALSLISSRVKEQHSDGLWLQGKSGDGSQFERPLSGEHMNPPWALPQWWTSKFQKEAALFGNFNADRLFGCEVVFYHDGTCYSITFGQEVRVELTDDCVLHNSSRPSEKRYTYTSSTYGVQRYRSPVPCTPFAAYEELSIEVADVPVPGYSANYAVSSTPCRTRVQYAFNTKVKESQCRPLREAHVEAVALNANGVQSEASAPDASENRSRDEPDASESLGFGGFDFDRDWSKEFEFS
mmetsp:Transcript_7847/g.13698  ORF Transcript_7847/g.13698 Transcript_7847/m.13698 type:complete len:243 (+) Transcript_7847:3-731(+)